MCAKQCLKAYRMEEIYDEHKFDRYATHYLILILLIHEACAAAFAQEPL